MEIYGPIEMVAAAKSIRKDRRPGTKYPFCTSVFSILHVVHEANFTDARLENAAAAAAYC
jgi:hypothetical protein